jgi:hypothetical protein
MLTTTAKKAKATHSIADFFDLDQVARSGDEIDERKAPSILQAFQPNWPEASTLTNWSPRPDRDPVHMSSSILGSPNRVAIRDRKQSRSSLVATSPWSIAFPSPVNIVIVMCDIAGSLASNGAMIAVSSENRRALQPYSPMNDPMANPIGSVISETDPKPMA